MFESLPELLEPQDPNLVPPFPGSVLKLIGPKSPFLKKGKVWPLLAYKGNQPVGRIAAIVNGAHNEFYQDKTGFFGFFDFVDDKEVAEKLIQEATRILKREGMTSLRGPYNPSVNDECGLLVDGFQSPPMIMMPYNPPYYEKMYEELGLRRVRDLFAYYLGANAIVPEKLKRVADRVRKRSGITFRNIEISRLDEELCAIKDLYNSTLKRNWGFVPITFEDLKFAAEDLKQILDPEFVMIAEKEGKPVGFSMLLPNINELLLKAKNRKGLFRILKFVWLLKTKTPKEARLAVLGVKPEFENLGIPAVFYFESFERGKKKIIGGELSWIEETNIPMIRSLELMGAEKYKTYRIFEAPL